MLPTLSPRSSRKRYDGTHGSIWMTPRAINSGPALPPPPAWTAAGASGPSRMRSAEACPVSQTRYAAAQGRQRLAAEGAQLVLRDCTAWLAHHHRRDHFLLPRVRHPDDIRLLDSGMGREKLLHFEWRDIDPPRLHHVLEPAPEMQAPLLVEEARVSAEEVPVRVEGGRGLLGG